ncbi:MAG: PEP-CTERM sorting domain-containing protein [Burkholderiales bacterium]
MQSVGFLRVTAALVVSAAFSQISVAQTILDENFNDVITLGNVSNVASPNICLNANCTSITPGLPTGTLGNSSTGTAPYGANTAPDNSNIRRGDNAINTLALPDGFGGFFSQASTNGFLVVGDDTNTIPDGMPNNGLSFASLPFSVSAGTPGATIAFDWSFQGRDSSNTANDSFIARVVNAAGTTVLTMLSRTSDTTAGYGSGAFNTTWGSGNGFAPGSYRLEFILQEQTANSSTQSALGIDNILVAAVPEPEVYALMLAGLGVIGAFTRRRRRLG